MKIQYFSVKVLSDIKDHPKEIEMDEKEKKIKNKACSLGQIQSAYKNKVAHVCVQKMYLKCLPTLTDYCDAFSSAVF